MKAASKTVTWAVACASLVGVFEGCDLTAKKDMIGTGHPLTWCHGETIGDAHAGQKFTHAECDAMLAARLPSYWVAIEKCIHVETSDNEKIAYTSAAYNFGSAGFCKSSMARKLNAGDHVGACDALMQYTHASGKFVQGLWNRRDAERKICLTPDNAPSAATRIAAIPKAHEKAAPVLVIVPSPAAKPAPKMFSWAWWIQA